MRHGAEHARAGGLAARLELAHEALRARLGRQHVDAVPRGLELGAVGAERADGDAGRRERGGRGGAVRALEVREHRADAVLGRERDVREVGEARERGVELRDVRRLVERGDLDRGRPQGARARRDEQARQLGGVLPRPCAARGGGSSRLRVGMAMGVLVGTSGLREGVRWRGPTQPWRVYSPGGGCWGEGVVAQRHWGYTQAAARGTAAVHRCHGVPGLAGGTHL